MAIQAFCFLHLNDQNVDDKETAKCLALSALLCYLRLPSMNRR
jgi:hypothetical protein